jgi:hypothetical protein
MRICMLFILMAEAGVNVSVILLYTVCICFPEFLHVLAVGQL